jgi:hypothetical protein
MILTTKQPLPSVVEEDIPKFSGRKRTRSINEVDWRIGLTLKKTRKDGHDVRYFITGEDIVPGDRDFVARTMAFFSVRGKRAVCPPAAEVIEDLPDDVSVLSNRSAANPFMVVFNAAKHIFAMCSFLAEVRADYHNVGVNISVDNSPFFAVA